jgi:hypothetical protein
MPARVRITGGNIAGFNNEGFDAQVDRNGNLHVREGVRDFDNKVYEDTDFVLGDSPVTLDFNADTGRNAVEGWIISDGPGDFTVDISRDGLTFGDAFTMKKNEQVDLLRLNIDKLRITHGGTDSAYRVFLI